MLFHIKTTAGVTGTSSLHTVPYSVGHHLEFDGNINVLIYLEMYQIFLIFMMT